MGHDTIENIEFPSFLINSPEVKNECTSVNIWSLEALEGSIFVKMTPRAQCAENYSCSRYYGLQGPFWRYFRPTSPLQWTPIRRSHVVFRHNIPDSDEFSPQIPVNNHCEWPNIVPDTRIEPLFVEIGQN